MIIESDAFKQQKKKKKKNGNASLPRFNAFCRSIGKTDSLHLTGLVPRLECYQQQKKYVLNILKNVIVKVAVTVSLLDFISH